MPEAPDLEVTREYLTQRIAGLQVLSGTVLKPSVLRPLAGELASDIAGRAFEEASRRGKFLLLRLSGDRLLVVNAMLTGALQYSPTGERRFKRTCLELSLSNGHDLRYLDSRQMGKVYYATGDQLAQIPQLQEMGPDVLESIPFEEFRERLARFHGEIKGILTRGKVISGISNAYADEVLHHARIYPFRKRKQLTEEQLRRLHASSRQVVEDAIHVLRSRIGDDIHVKIRDFLQVHNKGGSPCPRCGGSITQITANQRITSYCRSCQPGMLIKS